VSNDYADVAQIEECGHERCNKLLEQGFVLIGVFAKNGEVIRRQPNPGGGPSYIKHDIRYVVGRRDGQPPFPVAGGAAGQIVQNDKSEKTATPA
jgi:hypothetical protein